MWNISVVQADKTLKKTPQKFICSAIIQLSCRYQYDRIFNWKNLDGRWSMDTMEGKCRLLDGNEYSQVFANDCYFFKIQPMDGNSKAGQTFRVFCREFGIPYYLTFDGSK